ncbi:hypothetical protein EHP00_1353 [Ecytonucleospora hepatopenaei]|uniref:Uncharacterized protein n=1 Tax=Ecytonucleospora hepatopenaei TaxID=646526 RepID=A0A1W0E340_9MICR|nr:hypothetical protein EHP00_1353 [Ecytonucleospora hepatopenaei]
MFSLLHNTFDPTKLDQTSANTPSISLNFFGKRNKNALDHAKRHIGKKEYPMILQHVVSPAYSSANKFKRENIPIEKNMHNI